VTISPDEFDMIALARRGLQALLNEAEAEVQMARRHELWDRRTEQLTPESEEAKATAFAAWTEAAQRLNRFGFLYPEPVAA
jgi:hypothetical protein